MEYYFFVNFNKYYFFVNFNKLNIITTRTCINNWLCQTQHDIVAVSFIGGGNHRPVASQRQTLSHNIVSRTPRLSEIRTHNLSGDRHLLMQLAYDHGHTNSSQISQIFPYLAFKSTERERGHFALFSPSVVSTVPLININL